MRTRPGVVLAAAFAAACLGAACGDDSTSSPSAPSGSSIPAPTTPAPGATTPTRRLSADLVGEWNLSLRVTEAVGTGCVAEAFQARIGQPEAYTLLIRDTGQVTISSPSDGLSCSFTAAADGDNGFTTYGVPGFYTCVGEPRAYACVDGTRHYYISFGQDIGGKVSGGRLAGSWTVFWFDRSNDALNVEATYEFSGGR